MIVLVRSAKSGTSLPLRILRTTFNDIYQNKVSRALEKSCPQGGILSPFLWLTNINDLLNEKIDKKKTVLYKLTQMMFV
jgi:hypothetical protein